MTILGKVNYLSSNGFKEQSLIISVPQALMNLKDFFQTQKSKIYAKIPTDNLLNRLAYLLERPVSGLSQYWQPFHIQIFDKHKKIEFQMDLLD